MRGLFASPLGFLIGLSLGALGAGGSMLAVPALVYAAGQNPQDATATSLLFIGTASVFGMVTHARAGRVHVRTGLLFGLVGIGGSFVGTALNRRLDPDALLLGFSVLVLVAAWRMYTACPTCTKAGQARALEAAAAGAAPAPEPGAALTVDHRLDAATLVKVVAAGTVVGFLAGLFGVGGGFVIVPALTLVLGLSMPDAVGTSLLVIAINSAVALAMRMGTSTIDWTIAVPFTISAVIGVFAGARLAGTLDPKRSLRGFAALLLVIGLYTAATSLVALLG